MEASNQMQTTTAVLWPDPTYSLEQAMMYDFAGITSLTPEQALAMAARYEAAVQDLITHDCDFLIASRFGSRWASDWGAEFARRLEAYGLPDPQTQAA